MGMRCVYNVRLHVVCISSHGMLYASLLSVCVYPRQNRTEQNIKKLNAGG